LDQLSDPDPEVQRLLAAYNFRADPFPWKLRHLERADAFDKYELTFPSPTRFAVAESNTVYGEYYVPRPVPVGAVGAVVMHILDGRFLVARFVCMQFARMGMPCLLVKMPYYGERRPKGRSLASIMTEDPRRLFTGMQAAVRDVRRAACWLQQRKEVDGQRLGIIGVSLGAIASALAAGVDPRFNRAALILGGGNPGDIVWHAPETALVRRRLQETGQTLEKVREIARGVDPVVFAHRVDRRHVLMINAMKDKTIPRECTVALWEAFGKPRIDWQPAGHYSMSLFIPIILPQAFGFIRDLR
jgi:hypothetical protein